MSSAGQSISVVPPPPAVLIGPRGYDAALGDLAAGKVFVELCDDDKNGRAEALEALLRAVREETTLRWISNPLRSPLTLERLFLQAVGPEADLRVERSAGELAGFLQRAAGGARRFLLIVQQPETLDAEARDMLARIALHLADGPAAVQFLFCGSSGFRPILPARSTLPVLSLHAGSLAEARPSSRRLLVPLLLLVAAACLGGMLLLSRSAGHKASAAWPIETSSADAASVAAHHAPAVTAPAAPARESAAEPSAASLAAPGLETGNSGTPGSISPPPPDGATAPMRIDVATVRREFDTFLARQSPRIANLDQQQRDALFNEFLLHYRHGDRREP